MAHLKRHAFNSSTNVCIYCGADLQEGHPLAIMPWRPRQTTLIETTRGGRPKSQRVN
jgi:hypothetical protein